MSRFPNIETRMSLAMQAMLWLLAFLVACFFIGVYTRNPDVQVDSQNIMDGMRHPLPVASGQENYTVWHLAEVK